MVVENQLSNVTRRRRRHKLSSFVIRQHSKSFINGMRVWKTSELGFCFKKNNKIKEKWSERKQKRLDERVRIKERIKVGKSFIGSELTSKRMTVNLRWWCWWETSNGTNYRLLLTLLKVIFVKQAKLSLRYYRKTVIHFVY